MRSKIITGVVTAALAASLATGTAAAQDVGTPQHVGEIKSPQEYLTNGISELSSTDPYLRQHGSSQLHLAFVVGSAQLLLTPLLFLGSLF